MDSSVNTKKKVTKMKDDEIVEMRRTTKDLRRMFQDKLDKQQSCGPKTTSHLAATTTSTAAGRPNNHKVSPVKTYNNCFNIKKMCAIPSLIGGLGASVMETTRSRVEETGRRGGSDGMAKADDDGGGRTMMNQQSVVVVRDDDLMRKPVVRELTKVSVCVSGERPGTLLVSDEPGRGGGATRGPDEGGEGADGGVVGDGGKTGLKPRGQDDKKSLNLSKPDGGQLRRRSSSGIQSKILIFEKYNRGEILSGDNTDGECMNHVGRGKGI